MSRATDLWAANADLVGAALDHPFVRQLADGTLPEERFAGYVAQDAFFLEAYARAYGMGVARSPDRATLEAFADLLAGVRRELRLHDGYAARWGVDLAAVQPAAATLAYTDFLLAAAALGPPGVLAAAMTPCSRLYVYLARSLAAGCADRYREWVDTYAGDDFDQLAATLEGLLDRADGDAAAMAGAYRRAMQLEVGFFTSAYGGAPPSPPPDQSPRMQLM